MNEGVNYKMNPLEYLVWVLVIIIGWSVVDGFFAVLITAIQKRDIKMFLGIVIIITAVFLLFKKYRDHQEKKKEKSKLLEKLKIREKQYIEYFRVLCVLSIIIGLQIFVLMLAITKGEFKINYLEGLGISIGYMTVLSYFATPKQSEKETKSIEKDVLKSDAERKAEMEKLAAAMKSLMESYEPERDYRKNPIVNPTIRSDSEGKSDNRLLIQNSDERLWKDSLCNISDADIFTEMTKPPLNLFVTGENSVSIFTAMTNPPLNLFECGENSVSIPLRSIQIWFTGNGYKEVKSGFHIFTLTEKEPVIRLLEDDRLVCEYRLQTEGDEDFTGKYFQAGFRLYFQGDPKAPVFQMDGFISDTPEKREMTFDDIAYRMEICFLPGGAYSEKRSEMNRGKDLLFKALKYPNMTTPGNVRLVGICPECGNSFAFHGYEVYMAQMDVAYSDDGLNTCDISDQDIDVNTWSYETEGKTFRYYNSFCCPYCGTPYIDYKKYPEMKKFGVSACVHLGEKLYSAD